jgi:hypothetical protein
VKFLNFTSIPALCWLLMNRRNWHSVGVSFVVFIRNMSYLLFRAKNDWSWLVCMIPHVGCQLRWRDHVLRVKFLSNLKIWYILCESTLINFRIHNMKVGSSNILRNFMIICLKKMIISYFWDLIIDCIDDLIWSLGSRPIDVSMINLSFLHLFRNTFGRWFLHSIEWLHINISSAFKA